MRLVVGWNKGVYSLFFPLISSRKCKATSSAVDFSPNRDIEKRVEGMLAARRLFKTVLKALGRAGYIRVSRLQRGTEI